MTVLELMLLRTVCILMPFIILGYLIFPNINDFNEDAFDIMEITTLILSLAIWNISRFKGLKFPWFCILIFVLVLLPSAIYSYQRVDPFQVEMYLIITNWPVLIHYMTEELVQWCKLARVYIIKPLSHYSKSRTSALFIFSISSGVLLFFIIHQIAVAWFNTEIRSLNTLSVSPIVENEKIIFHHHHAPLPSLRSYEKISDFEKIRFNLEFDNVYDYLRNKNSNCSISKISHGYKSGSPDDHVKTYCETEVRSFIGADAVLYCELFNLKRVDLYGNVNDKLYWTFNEVPIKIKETYTFLSNYTLRHGELNVSATLSLRKLEKKEFGEYKLWLQIFEFWGQSVDCPYSIRKVLLGRFILTEIRPSTEILYVPIGGMLYIQDLPVYYISSKHPISILHKVNNSVYNDQEVDIESVCESETLQGCSLFSFLRLGVYKLKYVNIKNISDPLYDKLINTVTVTSESCICHNAYGKHSFVIQRDFHDKSKNQTIFLETELPWKFLVLPRNWLFENKNYYTAYEEIYDNYVDKNPDSNWQTLLKILILDENSLLRKRLILESCLYVVWIADIIMILILVTKIYNCRFVIPISKRIMGITTNLKQLSDIHAPIGNVIWNNKNSETYDTFIINSEEDSLFVERVLLPVLEEAEHSVYYPKRDDAAGAGRTEISLVSEGVTFSRNFIVVCTDAFLHDVFENTVVFGRFVLSKIFESPKSKLCFLKCSRCDIPRPLTCRDQDYLIDWTTDSSEEEKLHYIRRWAKHHRLPKM